MNTRLVFAIIWWAVMIGGFIVAPVVATRYRGSHRRTHDAPYQEETAP